MNILQKMFLNHQFFKKRKLEEQGISADQIITILKADKEFFIKEVMR